MKRIVIFAVLVFSSVFLLASLLQKKSDNRNEEPAKMCMVTDKSNGSITFVVDTGLTPVEYSYRWLLSGEQIAQAMLNDDNIPRDAYHIIATSFADGQGMKYFGKDAFYQCILEAYAKHTSVSLSPDMIWLLISQGFARYVNAHQEEMRYLLVNHSGKMDLVIQSDKELLSEQANWPKLIDGFASKIGEYTKGDIAKTITADFSTTNTMERVASQITLMESVKAYFEYVVLYISCGIPSITLTGTPRDWERVLEKTKKLGAYGLDTWVKSLEPILQEFVNTAKGHPGQTFWQGMVKKQRINSLEGGGCIPGKPTEIDGWILKFFPDENGHTPNHKPHTAEMASECVSVDFKYRIFSLVQGDVVKEIPMELKAGFIGAEMDTTNNMLTPKIGWMVRVQESEEEQLADLRRKDESHDLHLRVKEVPEILAKMRHINHLNLDFTDKVFLPAWMDGLTIETFNVSGNVTDEEKAELKKRFPQICFQK